jgi:hypothetical protein
MNTKVAETGSANLIYLRLARTDCRMGLEAKFFSGRCSGDDHVCFVRGQLR